MPLALAELFQRVSHGYTSKLPVGQIVMTLAKNIGLLSNEVRVKCEGASGSPMYCQIMGEGFLEREMILKKVFGTRDVYRVYEDDETPIVQGGASSSNQWQQARVDDEEDDSDDEDTHHEDSDDSNREQDYGVSEDDEELECGVSQAWVNEWDEREDDGNDEEEDEEEDDDEEEEEEDEEEEDSSDEED